MAAVLDLEKKADIQKEKAVVEAKTARLVVIAVSLGMGCGSTCLRKDERTEEVVEEDEEERRELE